MCVGASARVASAAPSWQWNFNTVLCWSCYHGSEPISCLPRPFPSLPPSLPHSLPPLLLCLSLLPSLLPPSFSSHVGTAPIGGDTLMHLCVHRAARPSCTALSAGSAAPSEPLSFLLFPLRAASWTRPRLSLRFCFALAGMKAWDFRFSERNTRQENDKQKSREHLKSLLSPSCLSLSVFLCRHFFLPFAPSVPLECPIEEQREPNHCPALDSILLINGQHLVGGHQRFRHAVDGEWPHRAALPHSPIKLTELNYANNKLITASQRFSSYPSHYCCCNYNLLYHWHHYEWIIITSDNNLK